MAFKCVKCGITLGEEHAALDETCIECIADNWAGIVVKSPMASPNILLSKSKSQA